MWKTGVPLSENFGLPVRLLMFVVLYAFFVVFGLVLSIHSHGAVAYWPASGMLLGALLLSSRKEWPLYLLLAIIVRAGISLTSGGLLAVGFLQGIGNSAETVTGAFLLRLVFPTTKEFSTVQQTLGLIALCGIGSTMIGASICSFTLTGAGYTDLYWQHWRRYWVGDMLGILFVTPLILAWNTPTHHAHSRSSIGHNIEGVILFAATISLSLLVYAGQVLWLYTDFFYLIPLLIWAALRFGLRGVSANGFALAALSIWLFSVTPEFSGPNAVTEHRAIDLQLFLAITISTILILVAVLSDRQKSSQQLSESERYLTSAFETIPDAIALTDLKTGKYLVVNESFCQNTGYSRDELVGKSSYELGIWPDEVDRLGISEQIAKTGKASLFEARFRRKDGSTLIGLFSACTILIKGQPAVFSITADITPRKEAEETLERSLREKEVLLKEIHHRVKNNLQIISSLLNLQTAHTADDRIIALFRESQARIRSMALIHEHLYRSPNLASINFADYVNALTTSLKRSQAHAARRVAVEIDIPGVQLDIDTAIPCGLIINELVTNSFKYAFPDDRAGIIRIMMRRANSKMTLDVNDDGIGLPQNVSILQAKTLGLELVATLSEQIGATLTVDNTHGAHFHFAWKLDRA